MGCKIISLAEYRRTRRAQSRMLKRLIERHLVEAGRIAGPATKNLAVVRMPVWENDEE